MRRILVPLDGSKRAEAILPDAMRLAGSLGELILMMDVGIPAFDYALRDPGSRTSIAEAREYLDGLATELRSGGLQVRTQTRVVGNVPWEIDEAARRGWVDMIACATHGRGPIGRLAWGGVAWRATAHSSVPVLLRHPEDRPQIHTMLENRRCIMTPLDGSAYAEKALPLAVELAQEWNAPLWLVQVVRDAAGYRADNDQIGLIPAGPDEEELAAQAYLDQVACTLPGNVHTWVRTGPVVDRLVEMVEGSPITDIVMASHGRTGLPRVVLGSVADALVQRLHCPIIVIPAMAAGRLEDHDGGRAEEEKAYDSPA